jgi:hypothetical protein
VRVEGGVIHKRGFIYARCQAHTKSWARCRRAAVVAYNAGGGAAHYCRQHFKCAKIAFESRAKGGDMGRGLAGGFIGKNAEDAVKLWEELPRLYPLGSWWRVSQLGICQVAGYSRDATLGPLVCVTPRQNDMFIKVKPHAMIPGALLERLRG